MMYEHLQKWGPRKQEVKFFLRHEDSPTESSDQGAYWPEVSLSALSLSLWRRMEGWLLLSSRCCCQCSSSSSSHPGIARLSWPGSKPNHVWCLFFLWTESWRYTYSKHPFFYVVCFCKKSLKGYQRQRIKVSLMLDGACRRSKSSHTQVALTQIFLCLCLDGVEPHKKPGVKCSQS